MTVTISHKVTVDILVVLVTDLRKCQICYMSSHKIVYLDESYLSNMAKASQNDHMNAGEREFWKALFHDSG
jgi:hypothetical protein